MCTIPQILEYFIPACRKVSKLACFFIGVLKRFHNHAHPYRCHRFQPIEKSLIVFVVSNPNPRLIK